MPALQIKDCPVYVYDELRECATRENRSISQQALTIIEDYLGLRERPVVQHREDMPATELVYGERGGSYITRRKALFARIAELPAIPVTKATPTSAQLLQDIRAEETR